MNRGKFMRIWSIFDMPLRSSEKIVYAYLTGCANNEDIAFPSIPTISEKCSITQNTARRAVSKLEELGYLKKQACFSRSSKGTLRQTSNRYHITPPQRDTLTPAKETPAEYHNSDPLPAKETGEINNRIILNNKAKSFSMSAELEDILEGLQLHLYEDSAFAKSVEMAVRDMYHAEHITVGGCKVEQSQVRSRLRELDTDCIDHVKRRLSDYAGSVVSAKKYLTSCIYNAPPDRAADLAAFAARWDSLLPQTEQQ